MYPYLFGSVPTYMVTYVGGLLLFLVVCLFVGGRMRVPLRQRFAAAFLYALGMVVGAKILYDVQNGGFKPEVFYSVEHHLLGGLWGGGLAVVLLATAYGFVLGDARGRYLDMFALSLPLPLALAKVGCVGVGCCHGCATNLPWAISLEPNDFNTPLLSGPIHPTQVYDFVLPVGIQALLWTLRGRVRTGSMLLWFLASFGATRFLTEFLRGDTQAFASTALTSVQWLCLLAVVGASVFLWVTRPIDSGRTLD